MSKLSIISKIAAAIIAATAIVGFTPAQAGTLTFEYDLSFGQTPAGGGTPWLTAVFDDGGSAGSVTLTMTVAGTMGDSTVKEVYFNLDTAMASSDLTIIATGGTGPAPAGGEQRAPARSCGSGTAADYRPRHR